MTTEPLDLPALPIKPAPRVVRMLNPAAGQLPEVKALALAANRHTQDPEFRTMTLLNSCRDPRVGIFIGLEGGLPRAMAAIELPFGDLRLCEPRVAVTTNFGSRALGVATWEAAAAWARSMGVRRLYAANTSGHSDAAYLRNIRAHGVKARIVYSLVEVNIGDPDDTDPGRQTMPPIARIYDFSAPVFQPQGTAPAALPAAPPPDVPS